MEERMIFIPVGGFPPEEHERLLRRAEVAMMRQAAARDLQERQMVAARKAWEARAAVDCSRREAERKSRDEEREEEQRCRCTVTIVEAPTYPYPYTPPLDPWADDMLRRGAKIMGHRGCRGGIPGIDYD